jgi:hypothetical protein
MLPQVDSALLRKDELGKHLQWRLCGRAVTDLSKTSGMHIKSLIDIKKVKVKQSLYTPWRRLWGEEV